MKQARMLAAVAAMAALVAGGALAAEGEGEAAKEGEARVAEAAAAPVLSEADEKKRKAAEAAEARRLAAIEREKERKFRQEQWERRCVIKPAMSDEEIAICREVRTNPAPAVLPAETRTTGAGPFSGLTK